MRARRAWGGDGRGPAGFGFVFESQRQTFSTQDSQIMPSVTTGGNVCVVLAFRATVPGRQCSVLLEAHGLDICRWLHKPVPKVLRVPPFPSQSPGPLQLLQHPPVQNRSRSVPRACLSLRLPETSPSSWKSLVLRGGLRQEQQGALHIHFLLLPTLLPLLNELSVQLPECILCSDGCCMCRGCLEGLSASSSLAVPWKQLPTSLYVRGMNAVEERDDERQFTNLTVLLSSFYL